MKEVKKKINLHNQYSGIDLDEKTVSPSPVIQFETWMQDAVDKNIADPNAMVLATADPTGKPSTRVVLLRDFSDMGFIFYTNYNSQKGQEIDANPRASLLFFWPKLQRQVRIEGMLEKIKPETSKEYFKERPLGNQISAWISPQSAVVDSRTLLERKYKEFEKKYQDKEIPYPVFWGGYCLKPLKFEFWQGQLNRLHDRIQYVFNHEEQVWKISRLAP